MVTGVRVDSGRALRYITQVRETAQRWGHSRITIVNQVPYTLPIETGRTKRGRIARLAGGAYMMRDGLDEVKPRIAPLITDAFLRGPSAVPLAEANIGRMTVAAIQRRTPVRSGRLRGGFVWKVA